MALALWVLPGLQPALAQNWYYTRLKGFDAPPPPSGPVGNDGSYPRIRLVPDGSGAFLGGTDQGGLADGAMGKGTLFTITPAGAFTRIYSFDPLATDGGWYLQNLAPGTPPDTAFYGQMFVGGANSAGRIVRFDPAAAPASQLTTLYSFSRPGPSRGSGGFIMGSDGWFYGLTEAGGNSDRGTIFRFDPATIQPDGTGFETLHSFDLTYGAEPRDELVEASNGVFYGTTYTGGAAFAGTIFKLDTTTTPPTFTSLYSFPKNGSGQFDEGIFPTAGLVYWGGYLYGTAVFGGANNFGTVFKFDPAAKSMVWVKSFTGTGGAQPGNQPSRKLLLGAGGTILYGTTVVGGTQNAGTVFSITSDGTFTKLYSFSGWDGQSPMELTEVSDGILLGTTYIGAGLGGNVFKLEAPGVTATVSGGGTICGAGSANIQAALTGAQPWSVTWSDGVTQSGITTSPVTRSVSPSSTTVYTLTAFSDFVGLGTAFGSATVTVSVVPAAPAITAPPSAVAGQSGLTASVSPSAGSSYLWTITNGTITSPAGPPYTGTTITFATGSAGTTALSVVETNAAGCAGAAGNANVTVTAPPTVTATVGGGGLICGTGSVLIQAALAGTPPWSLTWSDGVSQSGITTSPAWRYVSPSSTTVYTLTAFSDANGAGTISGSATATVSPRPSPVITTTWVRTPVNGWTASVPYAAGRSWAWTVSSNGTIESGQGTNEIFVVRDWSGGVDILVTETDRATGCWGNASTVVGSSRRVR